MSSPMDVKNMTDEEVNEAVARITGWESHALEFKGISKKGKTTIWMSPGAAIIPGYGGIHKKPPDYCNDPVAMDRLMEWLEEEQVPYSYGLNPGDVQGNHHVIIWHRGLKCASVKAGNWKHALAEAVVLAFGKEQK